MRIKLLIFALLILFPLLGISCSCDTPREPVNITGTIIATNIGLQGYGSVYFSDGSVYSFWGFPNIALGHRYIINGYEYQGDDLVHITSIKLDEVN